MNESMGNDMINDLFDVILKLENRQDCEMLFKDLCTANEVLQMAQRVRAAKLVLEKQTYAQIIEKTDISSATLSRVSTCVHFGSGGYKKFISADVSDTVIVEKPAKSKKNK